MLYQYFCVCISPFLVWVFCFRGRLDPPLYEIFRFNFLTNYLDRGGPHPKEKIRPSSCVKLLILLTLGEGWSLPPPHLLALVERFLLQVLWTQYDKVLKPLFNTFMGCTTQIMDNINTHSNIS